MTTQEFAAQIKQKYPVYKNVDDATLVSKIIEKYPVYKDQVTDVQQTNQQPNYIQRVAGDVKTELGNVKKDVTSTDSRTGLSKGISAVADTARAVIAPIAEAPGFKQLGELFGKTVDLAGNGLADLYTPEFQQKVASMSPEEFTKFIEPLQGAKNLGDIANTILLAKGTQKAVPAVKDAVTSVADNVGGAIANTTETVANAVNKGVQGAKTVASEVIPSAERVVNYQVTRALDLTQGDIKNISKATGHEVGQYLADRNLIGKNKVETQKMVDQFYNQNYSAVRDEIAKVDNIYKQASIPRYVEALKAIKRQVDDVPGLQKTSVEVENLLNKKSNISLSDVQRVKELLDEHFNLYKVTGDVKEGVAKEGLANIRSDLKTFIEKEVKDKTGGDIAKMNNDVATSRSIKDAIESRSTRGLTQSNIKMGDLGIFGTGSFIGGPLFGAALVFGKKILESSAVRLRFSKFLDGVSDAKKARIIRDLENGKVPKEIEKITQDIGSSGNKNQSTKTMAKPKSSISKTIPNNAKKSINKKK